MIHLFETNCVIVLHMCKAERHKFYKRIFKTGESCLVEAIDVVKELLSKEENVLNRWTRYLAAYKVVEGDLSLFDKLARCRDFREFETAMYEALRVKDRVRQRLYEGLRRKEISIAGDLDPERFNVDDRDLRTVMNLATKTPQAPRAVGALIASFGLAYGGIREVG